MLLTLNLIMRKVRQKDKIIIYTINLSNQRVWQWAWHLVCVKAVPLSYLYRYEL